MGGRVLRWLPGGSPLRLHRHALGVGSASETERSAPCHPPIRAATPRRHLGRRRRGLQPPDVRGRGGDARHPCDLPGGDRRPGGRAPGADLRRGRRRRHGRVREPGAGRALRGGGPARARAAQRRPAGAPPHGVPHRPQPGRRDRPRRRPLRGRGEHRRAAAGARRAGRGLHLRSGPRADRGQARLPLPVRGRADGQEHRAAGARPTASIGRWRRPYRSASCRAGRWRCPKSRRSRCCRSPISAATPSRTTSPTA